MAKPSDGANRLDHNLSMLDRISLKDVDRLPEKLEPGELYYSDRFRIAAHSCACGCGERVITPVGKLDWSLKLSSAGPTLSPSIGNWNLPCRSHYWIREGKIVPARSWSNADVEKAAARERQLRQTKSAKAVVQPSIWTRVRKALKNFVGLS